MSQKSLTLFSIKSKQVLFSLVGKFRMPWRRRQLFNDTRAGGGQHPLAARSAFPAPAVPRHRAAGSSSHLRVELPIERVGDVEGEAHV